MTGQKDRYTTTEKLWKLDDEMLTTPKHDEMVLWLIDKKNVSVLFPECTNPTTFKGKLQDCMFSNMIDTDLQERIYNHECITEKHINDIQSSMHFNDDMFEGSYRRFRDTNHLNEFINEYELDYSKLDIEPKFSMLQTTKYVVCQVILHNKQVHKDKMITEWKRLIDDYEYGYNYLLSSNTDVNIKSEVPITAQNGFLVGYVDIVASFCHERYDGKMVNLVSSKHPIIKYIEVKPTIRSFGQTLRQIRTYQHYLENTPNYGGFYIFTSDKKFKKAFESQGIKVLTYPE